MRARYESIHKAVQYKNSGATKTGIMNESDVITMGFKETSSVRGGSPQGAQCEKGHYPMPKKVRPLHEGIVKVSQQPNGNVENTSRSDRGRALPIVLIIET